MRSRLFLSLVILAAVIGTTAFGAFAFFAKAYGQTQTISAATPDINLTACGSGPATVPDLTNVYPGMPARSTCVRVTNDGTAPLNIYFSLAFPSGDASLEGMILLDVTGGVSAGSGYLNNTSYTTGRGFFLTNLPVSSSVDITLSYSFPETGSDQSGVAGHSLGVTGTFAGYTN